MYAYCNNNPVMYVDPEGESVGSILVLTGILLVLLCSLTSSEARDEGLSENDKNTSLENCIISGPDLNIYAGVGGGISIPKIYEMKAEYAWVLENGRWQYGEYGGNRVSLDFELFEIAAGNQVYTSEDGRKYETNNYFEVKLNLWAGPDFCYIASYELEISLILFKIEIPF